MDSKIIMELTLNNIALKFSEECSTKILCITLNFPSFFNVDKLQIKRVKSKLFRDDEKITFLKYVKCKNSIVLMFEVSKYFSENELKNNIEIILEETVTQFAILYRHNPKNSKLTEVKFVKELFNLGLKEAKDIVYESSERLSKDIFIKNISENDKKSFEERYEVLQENFQEKFNIFIKNV